MAKKRTQKRKSEVKADQSEENHEEEVTTNGNNSSVTPNKKKKSGVKNETLNNTAASVPKKKSNAKSDSAEDNTDYEVLKIVDVRSTKSNKREFLIRWKNYSPKQDSWEPEENLSCDDLITKFLEDNEKRSKEPSKQLRKKPSKVTLFASPGSRRSKRTGGNQKNYGEDEDGDEE